MVFILLNENFQQLYILDFYESLIWTDRFYECGDFELYTPIDSELLKLLRTNENLFVWSSNSDHIMIVDKYDIKTEDDAGSKIIITGRSAESLLERRVPAETVRINGNLQDSIEVLLNQNVINPSNPLRKIPNFIFKRTEDPLVTSVVYKAEYSGLNLYEILTDISKETNVSYRVYLSEDEMLVFELYSGVDRSYDQTDNPYVIFSNEFQNLGASNYTKSYAEYRNVVLLPIESSEDKTTYDIYDPYKSAGLNRRETIGDISRRDETVESAGKKTLKENQIEEMFEGQIDSTTLFEYGKDFSIGDIVQVRNEYGIESRSRVIELVMNNDQDTYEVYPTFESIKE